VLKVCRLLCAIFLCVASARAQEKEMSNLVFIIEQPLSNNKFAFEDAKKQSLLIVDWRKRDVDFYKNFIVEPMEYQIDLAGLAPSVTLNTYPGQSTYLRLAAYRLADKIVGFQLTSWTGVPDKAIEETIKNLKLHGFEGDTVPTRLDLTGNVIRLFPDAPWPIPPPPR
jgi:hypothetical protein